MGYWPREIAIGELALWLRWSMSWDEREIGSPPTRSFGGKYGLGQIPVGLRPSHSRIHRNGVPMNYQRDDVDHEFREGLVESTRECGRSSERMASLTAAWWARSSGFTSRVWAARNLRVEPRSTPTRIVLFSDPDTLRREGTSEWGATRDAIRALEERGVAVVLWGNETRSQMEVIQRDLDLHHPFVSETGAGLFVPNGYFDEHLVGGRVVPNYRVLDFGKPYYQVAEALHEVARRVGIEIIAFSAMSIEEVAQHCDLSLSQARLAKMREYDEPFRMLDPEPAIYSRVCSALRRLGLRCFTHEAFHHTTGVANKAQSLRLLASWYRHAADGPVLTVGLARARSETGLLQAVDVPVVVQSSTADSARLGRKVPTARFTSTDDPQSWCDAVLQLTNAHSSTR